MPVTSRSKASLLSALLLSLATSTIARADDAPAFPALSATNDAGEETWAIHGQSTFTWQLQPGFTSAYRGTQSLPAQANGRETFDATVFAGFRPWKGAEIWINPEFDQGSGLGNAYGVAGYLSGEAFKLGEQDPYVRLGRLFIRQTIDLGGESEKVAPAANTLGGSQAGNRLVFTAGKFSVTDIFDANQYAHDPRADFLNWSVTDAGSFDFAADSLGASYGAVAEWVQGRFTARAGLFDMWHVASNEVLVSAQPQQTQLMGELEERHTLWDHPGKLKLLYWISRGDLGTYNDALALAAAGQAPSTLAVRRSRTKDGVVLNLEQQLSEDLGLFMRAGVNQGGVETEDFTDVSQTLSAGLALSGNRWGRADDTVGLAVVVNQISHAGKQYLAAGGLGGIIGDGALKQAGPEQILESYYSYAAFDFARVSLDYQLVNNPAYNRQRGPVSVFAIRTHVEF